MNCPKCNAPLEPGDGFCANCGARLVTPPPVPGKAKKKRLPVKIIIIALAVVVVGGVALAALLTNGFGLFDEDIPKKADAAQMHQYFEGFDPINKQQTQANRAYWDRVRYEVTDISYNDKSTGSAKIKMTTPDMQLILEELAAFSFADENAGLDADSLAALVQSKLISLISESEQTVTHELTLPVKKIDRKWRLVPTEEWQKAVYGGGSEIVAQIFQDYMDAQRKAQEELEATL